MAKLKATPKSYAEAVEVLGNKDSVRLGHNTFLQRGTAYVGEQAAPISIRYHATDIVKFYSDGRVTLHTGGYRTVTTKDRINQFIYGNVYQKDYEWFYFTRSQRGHDRPFTEGMDVGGEQ